MDYSGPRISDQSIVRIRRSRGPGRSDDEKQYCSKFKGKVAVDATCGERALSQLASQYNAHLVQIGRWRKTALQQMAELFVDGRSRQHAELGAEKDALYE